MNNRVRKTNSETASRKDIFIAAIGVVGVIVTALFSNWDKLFPDENIVTSVYSGYQPSGNAEEEVKYLLYITGFEAQLQQMQKEIIEIQKEQLLEHFKDEPEILNKVYAIIDEELIKYNKKAIDLAVKTQAQYLTIQEIQELNKFYSTPIMREFTRRQPAVMKTFSRELHPLIIKLQETVMERVEKEVFEQIEE